MFPTLGHFLEFIFGINVNLPLYTFGTFFVLAILAAFYESRRGFDLKDKLQYIPPYRLSITTPEVVSTKEQYLMGLLYFIIGFKFLGIFFNYDNFSQDPEGYFFSMQGEWLTGILLCAFVLFNIYKKNKRNRIIKPKTEIKTIASKERMGNIFIVAIISGIIGAKIFHNLENWDSFIANPFQQLFSLGGLTFYGGLIFGAIGVGIYVKKAKIHFIHIADIITPGIMLAYGVGRLGCHFSGDGDWGIVNRLPCPAFIPDSLWSSTFPHNVINAGEQIVDCTGRFCNQLSAPVFPTSIYEALFAFAMYGILFFLSKKIIIPGIITSSFLVMNGIGRFVIEKIRVNTTYHLGDFTFTQAELISSLMFFLGVGLAFYCLKKWKKGIIFGKNN